MDLFELIDITEVRGPLVTMGEAQAMLLLLEPLTDGDSVEAEVARELRTRLAMRLPSVDVLT